MAHIEACHGMAMAAHLGRRVAAAAVRRGDARVAEIVIARRRGGEDRGVRVKRRAVGIALTLGILLLLCLCR